MRTRLRIKIETCWSPWLFIAISFLAGCGDRRESGIDAVVSGNSMTPAFWGSREQSKCGQCGYSFDVNGSKIELPETLVCPNCGFRSLDSSDAVPQPAQSVVIDSAHRNPGSPLQRWDVVAIEPSENRPAMIKRVVGLPNESIEFVHGDIYADGTIARKPLNVAREMRVPVFDSRFQSRDVLRRFQPRDNASGWKVGDGNWDYSPTSEHVDVEWLAYQQWRCVASHLPRDQPVPVEDWYAENVGVNRNLNATDDVWVEIECRVEGERQFDLKVGRGAASLIFKFDFSAGRVSLNEQVFLFGDEKSLSSLVDSRAMVRIEVCTFDRRTTLLINGHIVASIDSPATGDSSVSLSPVEIGGLRSKFKLVRFRLWRDIYYFDAVPQRDPMSSVALRAGSDEYLLLGDNVPLSIDSRHWPSPAIPADQILGRVFLPPQ